MQIRSFFARTLPTLIAAVFMLSAGVFFFSSYGSAGAFIPPFFDADPANNRFLFYITFFSAFLACGAALYGTLYRAGFLLRGFCLVVSFTAALVAAYALAPSSAITMCIHSAYIVMVAAAFPPPESYAVSGVSIVLFAILIQYPPFLNGDGLAAASPSAAVAQAITLAALAVIVQAVRYLSEKYADSEAAIAHLNEVGTKMLLFNHRLQEYAKTSRDEAVKKDRLCFTRDLHDCSGYAFTNIIAIANAAISLPEIETRETLHLIQNQAREGLKRTREMLHTIRELEEPVAGSIDTIYQMKRIFEEVMGVAVSIESGNMRNDYPHTVNMTLSQIVQEAFTNSVRHGQASRITISFWEAADELTMTVSDNGVGAQTIVKGIGLAGMEERLAMVGGTLEAFSPEDGGFRLRVMIPLGGEEMINDD
jgi:signal transduction histidine kinase